MCKRFIKRLIDILDLIIIVSLNELGIIIITIIKKHNTISEYSKKTIYENFITE